MCVTTERPRETIRVEHYMERQPTESSTELRNDTKTPTLTISVQQWRPGQKQLNKKKNKQKTSR